ncbi:MAG TPA: PilZ domain-containing protein [Methylomusa anaerophila]|uniref:Flagellar brake protein YcgR n=1 Tax=Methylomusa anaerophila TaxID=1930071 RepID=A0A348ALZ5_9FIRM|nr:flagellar brake domain-containing protein [Methylomusa anaerophila]BBB92093.1 flagellar brake protein YcgR [Methylomusa anaerophila]HML87893.1 PilZ domain-containing protein [Methylomusa anaerophila]
MDHKGIFRVLQKIHFIDTDIDADIDADSENYQTRIYSSHIEDIKEKSLLVAVPYSQGHYLPRRYLKEYNVRVTPGPCVYIFNTKLLAFISDPIPMWEISMPQEVKRIQTRGYARLDITLMIDVTIIQPDGGIDEKIATFTRDISGSGLGFSLDKDRAVPLGTKLKIMLPLGEIHVIRAEGEVIRVIPHDLNPEKNVIGLKFTKIANADRECLSKFIFRKQIVRRNKGQKI